MKNKLFLASRFALALLFLLAFAVSAYAGNGTADEAASLADGIIAANGADVTAWLDGALSDGAGGTSEWYVIALGRYRDFPDASDYVSALEEYIASAPAASAATRQKYALALAVCGVKDSDFVLETANDSIGAQGIMSWVFGLHLLNNGIKSDSFASSDVVAKILSLRLDDGGWALTGETSDVDVTAMTVQSLAPYYPTDENVRECVDGALGFLSEKQLADGDYMTYGARNAESCAQVIIALCSLGIDPADDGRFIKNGKTVIDGLLLYRLDDGRFCHTSGALFGNSATSQALCALVSLWRLRSGLSAFYVLETETPPPSDESASSLTESTTPVTPEKPDLKTWVSIAVAILAAAVCIVLLIRGKKNLKSYILVLVLAGAIICAVQFTDFRATSDYYGSDAPDGEIVGTVTISIRCDTVAGISESSYIPADGVILPATEVPIDADDTVYDVLVRAARTNRIQLENNGAPGLRGSAYINGINYLYEFDYGDLSGWVFRVNGADASVGCGEYSVADGDFVEWHYTLELGNDIE